MRETLILLVDVVERTIRRSVKHLVDLGVPVVSIRGRYGGYRLAPGYRMPPLMLTNEEALAVLLDFAAGIATLTEIPDESSASSAAASDVPHARGHHSDWVHVQLRAERLEWIPPTLAALDRPFVIEHPASLRDLIHALADRLAECADAGGPKE